MSRGGFIRHRGAAVTFTKAAPGVEDPETGLFSSAATSTVSGYAIRSAGDVETYKALELVVTRSITLDFEPDTAGQVPALDSAFTFASEAYTVKSVEDIAPNGTSRGCRVIGSR